MSWPRVHNLPIHLHIKSVPWGKDWASFYPVYNQGCYILKLSLNLCPISSKCDTNKGFIFLCFSRGLEAIIREYDQEDFNGISEFKSGWILLESNPLSLKLSFQDYGGKYQDKRTLRFSDLRRVSIWIPFITHSLSWDGSSEVWDMPPSFPFCAVLTFKWSWQENVLEGDEQMFRD